MSALDDTVTAAAVDGQPGPAAVMETQDGASAVAVQLAALPERQREALRLKFQADLSYKEIADVLDVTVNHVGVIIHTALKTLREKLARESDLLA